MVVKILRIKTLILKILTVKVMLQNFADAGKALYRVARKYASKVRAALYLADACLELYNNNSRIMENM